MRTFLTRSSILWALAFIQIALGVSFYFISSKYGFTLLDEIRDPETIRAQLDSMSASQKDIHIWTTIGPDTLYPLAYGGMFIGLAWRFLGRAGHFAAIPAILTILVDLTENAVQVAALLGQQGVIDSKAWLTPLKFGLFIVAAIIALVALGIAIKRKFSAGAEIVKQ